MIKNEVFVALNNINKTMKFCNLIDEIYQDLFKVYEIYQSLCNVPS